jgi:hypothetical protein
MATVTPDAIFQATTGFMAAKHLFVASEVGLFAHLAPGPTTLDTLAQRTGVPQRTLRILANAMVALGFVEKHGEHYQNGPVGWRPPFSAVVPRQTSGRFYASGISLVIRAGWNSKPRSVPIRRSLAS